jgi:hypothetical protein
MGVNGTVEVLVLASRVREWSSESCRVAVLLLPANTLHTVIVRTEDARAG